MLRFLRRYRRSMSTQTSFRAARSSPARTPASARRPPSRWPMPGMDVGITWHSDEDGRDAHRRRRARAADAAPSWRGSTRPNSPASAESIERWPTQLGGIDVFVNNAGGGSGGTVLDVRLERLAARSSPLNLDGAFVCLQAAARHMVDGGRGRTAIAVTSVHEHQPRVGVARRTSPPSTGSAALDRRRMALELGAHGITVNAVAPGEIATPTDRPGAEPTPTRTASRRRPAGTARQAARRSPR